MPLDSFEDNDYFKRRCIGWQRKLSIWPRRCFYTGKLIWIRYAYKGTAMITGPGEPVFIDRWVHPREYLFLKIKGTI
jgi:hypothetical protein